METPKEVGWLLVQNFDFCACLRFSSLKVISKCKTSMFCTIDNILGQVDPKIARKWHKPVQNAIVWKKCKSGRLCWILGFLL